MSVKSRVIELSIDSNPLRGRPAYLAEDYDGVGQYMYVRLSRGSSSSAIAKIPGASYRIPQEAGTAVSVITVNGSLQIVSMGNG